MRRETTTIDPVSRTPKAPDAEQQRLIDVAVEKNREWLKTDAANQKAEQEMWDAFERARANGVQANHLIDAIGVKPSRATFFRWFKSAK